MENELTPLQFTVSDRDMLRDTATGVKQILEKLEPMTKRVDSLEADRNKAAGALGSLKWVWGAIVALMGVFGWHVAKH